MPQYCYKCPECRYFDINVRNMSDLEPDIICFDCGTKMVRDYRAEGVKIGIHEYDGGHVSDSLGMHPEQIPEHQKRFPDIKVQSDGRPVFRDTNQHSKYLDTIGWEKKPSKLKRKAVKT